MEEAMSHTGDSSTESGQSGSQAFPTPHSHYGTDERVKLPNWTEEEVGWQGLEELYSVNESLYEIRPDYSPDPDDWANYQKDVDNMIALLLILDKLNQTHNLDDTSLAELGSGAGGEGLQEGSGEGALAGDNWPGLSTPNQAPEAPRITPVPITPPPPPQPPPPPPLTPQPMPETKLESVNDLPERPMDEPRVSGVSTVTPSTEQGRGAGPVVRGDTWAQQLEELEGEGQVFSGNGLTEMETHHDTILRTHNSLQAQLQPGQGQSKAGNPAMGH
ncbi:uncharacterized protein FYW47_002431 [Aplochiton taeniatus]